MHRERLHSLSNEELYKLAKDFNITNTDVFDRALLIEEICSVFVDPFYEGNISVQLLAKRYELVGSSNFVSNTGLLDFFDDPPHASHLYVVVHSLRWLFVDWHVGEYLAKPIREHNMFQALYLRLYVLERSNMGYELKESLDIEVDSFNGRRYLTLLSQRAHYRVILVADLLDRERILTESAITFCVGIE